MSDSEKPDKKGQEEGAFTVPEPPPMAERSLELPAVIIGDRGDADGTLQVRLLPGRVPESAVLYPVYTCVGAASFLASHFALQTGEWNPLMALLAWGLLYCWYWVYGVAYRYRRWMMKFFALFMSTTTALSLIWISAIRGAAMFVPGDDGLYLRETRPLLFVVAALTALSLAAILTHVVYLGRGYREKAVHDKNATPNQHSTP